VNVTCGTLEARLKRGTVVLVALALCTCTREKPKPFEENPAPVDYRAQIVDQVRRQLNPRNVSDAYVTEPALKTSLQTPRFISCLRFTSTDAGGAPRGSREYAAYFYAGKITQLVNATAEQCAGANYQPFPELLPPH